MTLQARGDMDLSFILTLTVIHPQSYHPYDCHLSASPSHHDDCHLYCHHHSHHYFIITTTATAETIFTVTSGLSASSLIIIAVSITVANITIIFQNHFLAVTSKTKVTKWLAQGHPAGCGGLRSPTTPRLLTWLPLPTEAPLSSPRPIPAKDLLIFWLVPIIFCLRLLILSFHSHAPSL